MACELHASWASDDAMFLPAFDNRVIDPLPSGIASCPPTKSPTPGMAGKC